MKKLIPVLIVVLAAILFVFMPSRHSTSAPDIAATATLNTYDEVETAIEKMGVTNWQREQCNVVRTDINHLYKNNVINEEQKVKLEKRLDVEYIKTLNAAAKDFFVTGKEDGLGPIYNELKKYKTEPEYKPQVATMLAAADLYFQLLRNKDVVNSVIKRKLLKEKVVELREDTKKIASTDPLSRSSHVQKIKNEIDVILDDFVTMSMEFESNTTDSTDCDAKYSKYDYYKNECKKQ
jgi:hypothetical protein